MRVRRRLACRDGLAYSRARTRSLAPAETRPGADDDHTTRSAAAHCAAPAAEIHTTRAASAGPALAAASTACGRDPASTVRGRDAASSSLSSSAGGATEGAVAAEEAKDEGRLGPYGWLDS